MNDLQQLEKFARKNNIPVLLDHSAKFLADFVKKHQFQNILEIGTAIGYSGTIMLLSSKNAHLTTIEKNEVAVMEARRVYVIIQIRSSLVWVLHPVIEHKSIIPKRSITPKIMGPAHITLA